MKLTKQQVKALTYLVSCVQNGEDAVISHLYNKLAYWNTSIEETYRVAYNVSGQIVLDKDTEPRAKHFYIDFDRTETKIIFSLLSKLDVNADNNRTKALKKLIDTLDTDWTASPGFLYDVKVQEDGTIRIHYPTTTVA